MKLINYIFLISTFIFLNTYAADDEVRVAVAATNFSQDQNDYLVVKYKNAPHWHTYWKNPGDAGIPISIKISADGQEIKALPTEYPTPRKYLEKGGLLGYGFEGEYAFFFLLTESLKNQLEGKNLEISSEWLVCKHLCVPGQQKVSGSFSNGRFTQSSKPLFNLSDAKIKELFDNIPRKASWPENFNISLVKGTQEKTLYLYYELSNSSPDKLQDFVNLLTPFVQEPFGWKKEELFHDGATTIYGRFLIEWDGEFAEPEIPFPTDGKFSKSFNLNFLFATPGDSKSIVINKNFDSFSITETSALEKTYASLNKIPSSYYYNAETKEVGKPRAKSEGTKTSTNQPLDTKKLLYYLVLAFIGGFILNFMPCVLPVISIKLFGLINHKDLPKSKIMKHNIAYTLGILGTFLVLATVVVLLKFGGEEVGWGFQLQSPAFVAIMVIGLFIFAVNLFGLFEFRTPGGNVLGGTQLKEGFAGDFMSGVIAVILSTPCSAPFLGTALTFAFTSHFSMIYLIFIAVGLGLAVPFILTGIFPKSIAFLPKPGMWMEDLKKFMGLTLLLTAAWLMDVFISLASGTTPVLYLNLILVFSFFAIYAYQKMSMKKGWKYLYLALPLFLSFQFFNMDLKASSGSSSQGLLTEKQQEGLPWEKWTPAALEEKKAGQKLVFMDFTANWCFTCKVNEKLVLNTSGFKEMVDKYEVNLLLADWTKRDNVIGGWLKKNGKVGVPAYFVQLPNGELIDLGETITLGKIETALKKANN